MSVPLLGLDRRVEVKGHASGVGRLYGWLAGADVLVIEADRKEPLMALSNSSSRNNDSRNRRRHNQTIGRRNR